MKPRVYGRAYIPHNRNVIVVANHASHLDMGFVRHALGKYGEDIVSLAAQDYFFDERHQARLLREPHEPQGDRSQGVAARRPSARRATIIERGQDGARLPGGHAQRRTATSRSSSRSSGTSRSRTASTSCRVYPRRHVRGDAARARRSPRSARSSRASARRSASRTCGASPRACPRRTRRARSRASRARRVLALRDGQRARPRRARREPTSWRRAREHPLVTLFGELEGKFRAGERRQARVSFYFSLGSDEHASGRCASTAARCEVRPGKPDGRRGRLRAQDEPGDLHANRPRGVRAGPGGLHVGRRQVERRGAAHDVPEGLPARISRREGPGTGATGFLGTHLVATLEGARARGGAVLAVDGRGRARRGSRCGGRRRGARGPSTAREGSRASPRTPRRSTGCTSRARRACSTRARRPA